MRRISVSTSFAYSSSSRKPYRSPLTERSTATTSPKSEFTIGPSTPWGMSVKCSSLRSWRSLDQNRSVSVTSSSRVTSMTTPPTRLVEMVLLLRTSLKPNSRCSILRVTCCSTCSAVAPG